MKGEADLSDLANVLLAIAMIASAALIVGGVRMLRLPENRRRGVLMIVAALVLIGNVAILTV